MEYDVAVIHDTSIGSHWFIIITPLACARGNVIGHIVVVVVVVVVISTKIAIP